MNFESYGERDGGDCMDILSKQKEKFKNFLEERQESKKQSPWYILSINGKLYKFWKAVTIIMCLMSSYIYLSIAAFRMHGYEDDQVM